MTLISAKSGTANNIAGTYLGQIVHSDSSGEIPAKVEVIPISENVVRVNFKKGVMSYSFRGSTRKTTEGITIFIQQKVTSEYILKGVEGFSVKNPLIHGGRLDRLGGLFFNIAINYYSGQFGEIYFFGRRDLN